LISSVATGLLFYGIVARPAECLITAPPRTARREDTGGAFLRKAGPGRHCARTWPQDSALLQDVSTFQREDDLQQIRDFEALIRKEKFQDVEPSLRAYIASRPSSWKAYYFLGYVLFREQRLSEAIKSLSKSLELNTNDAEAHNLLGKCLMVAMRSDLAEREFHETLRLDPDFAEAHYNLARIYSIRDDFPGARKEFESAVNVNPDYMEAYNALGFTLEALGDDAGALAGYQKSIQINERRAGKFDAPYVNLSGYYNSRGRTDQALEYARKALAVHPQSDLAYFQIARACRAQQDWNCVVDAIENAVRIRATSSEYFYILGIAYRKLGKTKESNAALEKFRDLEKRNGDLENQIRELRRKQSGLELRPEN